ncbi:hypothetical protein [Stutzerimonas stutzeri]|uniref:hypothetical protein n=1 Tax=Stutzerimonas stutzeri TaxID=316 RepID=UPI00066DC792|nr:hypothetical protein [Stutzerimonas stutzeri]
MATLQEQRQAIAAGMSASRAATGQASRQATGQAMIEQRTGKAVAADINRLTRPQQSRKTLSPIQPVGALPASRGRGVYKPPAAGGTAGIASPVIEVSAATRAYWPGGWPSNDGLLVLPAIRHVQMQDANGAEVIFDYADPSA